SDRHGPYEIARTQREHHEGDRLILNPLVAVDNSTGLAAYDSAALAGRADYLLTRHPVYAERLARQLPVVLTGDERRVLYWAGLAPELGLGDIQAKTNLDSATFHDVVRRLEACEVAHPAPVGAAMALLQHFHSTRRVSVPLHDQQFVALWRKAGRRYAERTLIMAEDGSAFAFSDVEEIVGSLAAILLAKGVAPKRPLAIISAPGTEAILAIWAAWLLGSAVVPLDTTLGAAQLAAILERVDPALVLVEASSLASVPARFAMLSLAADDASDGVATLGDEIANHAAIDLATLPSPDESTIATILFTSGSTGQPKGVRLTQGALWRGSHAIAGGFGWNESDILLSAGGLHTMSGLRNPCVAALAAGASIVLPDPRRLVHPATLAEAIRRWQVTLLAAVPAMLGTILAASKQKVLRFAPLRQVALTGSTLSRGLQEEGEQAFGAPAQVYYGLTETAGICLLVPPGESREADGDVGLPAGAIARIVGEGGGEVSEGEVGELQIYSANLTAGYLDEPAKSAALFDRGWLRTGDLARRTGNGHVILLGRRDEQIKNRFGEIVQPAAIESVLHQCDGLDEAAVVGIGEGADIKVVAFVVPRGAGGAGWLAELQARVIQVLGPRQSPDRFIERQALPRLSGGKVAREALRL
ncbi:MAG TPA: class I adenylate-forming enzyme family protein, partial [Dongiaceae bacterium]|nr:class I adenylate-forming enzyme family protein [Dongiaceae bacterium]